MHNLNLHIFFSSNLNLELLLETALKEKRYLHAGGALVVVVVVVVVVVFLTKSLTQART